MTTKESKKSKDFDLNKRSQAKFDINKGPSHKFDLSKDDDEDNVLTVSKSEQADPASSVDSTVRLTEGSEQPTKSRRWIWMGLIVVLLLGVGIWWFMSTPAEQTVSVESPETEQIVNPIDTLGTSSMTSEITIDETSESEELDGTTTEATKTTLAVTQGTQASGPIAQTSVQTNQVTQSSQTSQSSQTVATQSGSQASADTETEALNVIRGKYGDGNERRQALGDRYAEIQARVNQMKREGLF